MEEHQLLEELEKKTSMSCSTNDKGNIYSEDVHKLKSLNMALKTKTMKRKVIICNTDSD